MRILYSGIAAFLFLGTACIPQGTPLKVAQSYDVFLDSIGERVIKDGKILGFSVSIDSAGTTIYNGNFGHIDTKKTKIVDNNTRFDIASISKMIGVAVILKLVEQEKLSLEQTLEELLPDFPEKELARKITLRHMISHTSGLLDNTKQMDSLFLATGLVPQRDDFFTFFYGKNLLYQPGTNYQYSNPGFIFMAFIAERVTKKSWQELVDEIVNKPTGLDFRLIKHVVDHPGTSPIFENYKEGFKQVPTWVYVLGDGGLTATSEMLSKFPRLLAKEHIINKASYETMISPKFLIDSIQTGYGFGVRNGQFLEERILGHTGGWKSTFAIMAYFPEHDLTFTGLMNTDNTPEDIYSIFSQFMGSYLKKPLPNYTEESEKPKHLEELVGRYHGFGDEFDNIGRIVEVRLDDHGRLNYCMEESCIPLYYMGSNRFWLEAYPYDYIEFQMGNNSQAIREYYHGFFQILRVKIE